MTEPRLITADHLCVGFEEILKVGLPMLVDALEYDPEEFQEVKVWQQAPDLEALSTAQFPAAVITSTGTGDKPVRTGFTYDAKWNVVVGIYDRGKDHGATAKKARTWAALIRAVMIANPSVGGLASTLRWTGETFANRRERTAARTLSGCAVTFTVGASNVVDLGSLDPRVQTTQTSLDVPSPQE